VESFVGRWLAGALVIASCALAGAPARAQSDPPAPPAETPAEADDGDDAETVYRADEIVVEEDPDEQPPTEVFADTPVEKEVLPREEVERRPGTTAADLMRTLPGVRQQQRVQGEEAAVSIEGLPPEFTRALVDGERYTGEIGAVDDFRTLPLFDVERVEVLRGAQALRYGSESAGGVVRIDTPDPPSDGWRGAFEGGYGGSNWIYGAGTAAWGNETIGGWLRFVNDEIDGFDEPDDVPDSVRVSAGKQSQRVSRDVYGKLRVDPLEGLGFLTRFGWRSDDESGLAGESGVGDREEHRWFVGEHGEWQLGEATRLVGHVTWYDNELTSDVGRAFEMREREPSGRMALEHLLQTGSMTHGLTAGFDVFGPRLELDNEAFESDIEDPIFQPDQVRQGQAFGGVYAMTESEITSWLRFEGGVRAQFHTDYTPQLLPQVAVLVTPWQPDERRFLRLRASWGMGYRTPSLRDLYQPPVAQLGGAYFLAGNPDLEPEHVQSARAGIEMVPFERITVSATAFYNDIEDHIRSTRFGSIRIGTDYVDPPPLTPAEEELCERFNNQLPVCSREPDEVPIRSELFVKQNLDQVKSHGVETRLRVRPHPLVDVELAYTWLKTEVQDDTIDLTELPNEPEHVVDALLGFEVPRARTRVAALARWRGEAITETSGTGLVSFGSPEKSDPSLTIDLRVVQPIGETRFQLYADLFNVTDERVVDSYVVRGRTLFVGLRGSF
jgi:outer membrane receptor for ferrienterochelin and colicins